MKIQRLLSLLAIVFLCSCEKEEEAPIILYTPSVVEIGSYITIGGKNFGERYVGGKYVRNEVMFNGVPATQFSVSNDGTRIDCLVPDNITPGKITVSRNSLVAESPNEYLVSNWKLLTPLFQGIGYNDAGVTDMFCKYNNSLFFKSENSIVEFNLETKTWTKKTDFPLLYGESQEYLAVAYFTIDNRIYFQFEIHLYGANGGEDVRDFYEYNLDTNQWTKKSDFPIGGSPSHKLGFSLAGKGYFIFGDYDRKELWGYDPNTNTWTLLADFPGPLRDGFAIYETPTHVYFGAGHLSNGTLLKDRWQYEPISNTWTKVEDFPGAGRIYPVIFYINNHIYYGLGAGSSQPNTGWGSLFDFYDFDPSINNWSSFQIINGDNISYPTNPKETFSHGDKGYLNLGGQVWEFNP